MPLFHLLYSTSHPRSPAQAKQSLMNLPWHRFLPRYVPASSPSVFIPWLQNKGFAWSKKKKGLGHLCGYALHELVSGCLGFSKYDALKQGTYERRFQGPISTSKSTFHEIRLARKSEAVGGRQIRNRLLAIPLWRGSKLL
jgi:hypothetical protein